MSGKRRTLSLLSDIRTYTSSAAGRSRGPGIQTWAASSSRSCDLIGHAGHHGGDLQV